MLAEPVPAGAGPGALAEGKFRASLEEIRAAGYALGYEEITGWGAVAAPVLWGETVYGAISVVKPSSLLTDTPRTVAQTVAAADRFSLLVSGGNLPLAG